MGGCLTFAFGLFHEQEQVVEGAQVPAVRGADEEEGTAEAGSQRWPCVGCLLVAVGGDGAPVAWRWCGRDVFCQLGVCRLTVGKLTGLPVVMLPVCRGWACPVGGFWVIA